jgi:hypothetical protein
MSTSHSVQEERRMPIQRTLLVAVVAAALVLVGGGGVWMADPARALPPGQEAGLDPMTIPYAGRLTGDDGQPVADGAYALQLALYAASTGGEPLWTETQAGVAVRGGAFGVAVGGVNAIPKGVLEGSALWLALSVRGPGEADFTLLEPRQQISLVAPAATTSSSCEHTHLDEWWTGSSSSAGLVVDNRAGTGDGIRGYATSPSSDYGGVYGVNFASGPGVYGRSDGGGPGVAGYSNGRGVYGSGADGVVGESSTSGMSGVYGVNSSTGGYGITGRADGYFGVLAWGDDSSLYDKKGDILLRGTYGEIFTFGDWLNLYSNNHVIIDLDDDNNSAGAFFRILSGSDGILWTVSETTGVIAAGSQASVVEAHDGSQRLMYSIQGTGVWLEDVGTAALVDGKLTIAFDPVYAGVANLKQGYQVFVTAQSERPVLLTVAAKTATGFTVRGVTLDGQPATCTFDYRVVAHRLEYESVRTEEFVALGKAEP